jgi:hypothetical protein
VKEVRPEVYTFTTQAALGAHSSEPPGRFFKRTRLTVIISL